MPGSALWLALAWDRIAVGPSASTWEPPVAAAPREAPAPAERCAHYDPLRQAWFGDLHIHTGYSMDARSRGMLGTPDDAYRFARGQVIGLGPFDDQQRGMRPVQLEMPLDFAAVTDHAEWIGEISVCTRPGSPGYDSNACQAYRGEVEPEPTLVMRLSGRQKLKMIYVMGFTDRNAQVCGPDNAWCRQGAVNAWQDMQKGGGASF